MSDMHDDELNALKNLSVPAASPTARRRALDAAMLAFDAGQEKSQTSPQGTAAGGRLRSIFHALKGPWIMDARLTFGLGTAAVVLLLLPLGYQLYTSTALTPVTNLQQQSQTVEPVAVTPEPVTRERNEAEAPATTEADKPLLAETPKTPKTPAEITAIVDGLANGTVAGAGLESLPADGTLTRGGAPAYEAPAGAMAEQSMSMDAEAGRFAAPAPMPSMAAAPKMESYAGAEPQLMPTADPSGDEFTDFKESPVKVVAEEPVSTFSVDVDTASYTYVRNALNNGYLPPADSIRIEEMINYFDYDYAGPDDAATPFKATMQIYPTPWNPKTQLLQIGIKGYVPPADAHKPSNLVFLLDTSGSMDEPNKLPLLKRAFGLLVNQLGADDTVSIVAYAGSAGVVLEPTRATDKARILGAIDTLAAGGSTAGAQGIELAYQLAAQHKVDGGVNRVILATDGDFNVGIDDPDDLIDYIKTKRDQGIFLSVLGFGSGNYGDDTMQALAQNGNGNASYIDSYKEAQKVLVHEIGGTLETIAKDVKIQVEFNPAVVSEYRLVGYETRALNREDFNNDKVDAGDIGAGHTVTAIYELTPVGSGAELVDPLRYGGGATTAPETTAADASDEIGFLKMRFKLPEGSTSSLIETPITPSLAVDSLAAASNDARWAAAVAAFAQKLKGSSYGGTMSYEDIKALAQGARGADTEGYRAEFIQLINSAEIVSGTH